MPITFNLSRQQLSHSLINHAMSHCGACKKKWKQAVTDPCPGGEIQTMTDIVDSCPLTKLNGGLSLTMLCRRWVCMFLRRSYLLYLCAASLPSRPNFPDVPTHLFGLLSVLTCFTSLLPHDQKSRDRRCVSNLGAVLRYFHVILWRSTVLWVLEKCQARSSCSVCCEGSFGDSRWEWEWVTHTTGEVLVLVR